MCGNRQYIDQREFNGEHDTDNMPRESTHLFHHLLYLYICASSAREKHRRRRTKEIELDHGAYYKWPFLWEHLQEVQASHPDGCGSAGLYFSIFYHRGFFRSWNESSCLYYLPTYCSWCSHAPFCLFS